MARVDGGAVGGITRPSLVVLVDVMHDGGSTRVAMAVRKIADLRLLEGELSATDAGAPALVVSQSTPYVDTRKDRRPVWDKATPDEVAEPLVEVVTEGLRGHDLEVAIGRLGANMEIDMEANGSVTTLIEVEQADEAEDAAEGDAEVTGCSRAVVVAMMLWWAVFGCISISWTLGSPWLVDTALQGDGLRLTQERSTQFVVVVLVSGLMKLGFVVFSLMFLHPDVIRVSRWIHLTFGQVPRALLMAYGMVGSAPVIPTIMSGEPFSRYGWWRLVPWMPYLWIGGILVLAITVVYFRWNRSSSVELQRV